MRKHQRPGSWAKWTTT